MPLIETARIANEPVLRYTQSGKAVLSLSLPVEYGQKGQDGKRNVQWLDVSLWDKRAESLAPYLVKGQWVSVTVEELHIEEYESNGQKRSKLVGRIEQIKFVGDKPKAALSETFQAPKAAQAASLDQFDDLESLPF